MNQVLIWLSVLVVLMMPIMAFNQLTFPETRDITGRGISLEDSQPLKTPTKFKNLLKWPSFSTAFKSGKKQRKSSSRWPLEYVKFDHPIQSPIDLLTSKAVTMNLPVLDIVEPPQPDVKAKVYNSGHTVYVYIKEDPSLRPQLIGGPLKDKFIFEQMHFHWGSEDIWGSEHLIDGESYAVEIHMVHYNSKYENFEKAANQSDGLAVLTVFAEGDDNDNLLLDPLYRVLPDITQPSSYREINSVKAMQWVASGLNMNHEYYTYPGSLTTPPYSENVIFILLPKPITLSHKQLQAFRNLHSDHHGKILENKRQVQPSHNRPIVRSVSVIA